MKKFYTINFNLHTFLVFCFLLFSFFSYSQEIIEPYYDPSNGKWGFHTKEFHKIIVPAQFDDATGWYKDYGIVMIDDKYGLIDRKGNKVSPFVLDYLGVEECESCLVGELYGIYFYESYMRADRKFYVNENCDCIPKSYWPCPPMVKMDTSATPKNLKILQQAEYAYHQGEIKKSLLIADRAIAADTNDASTYFWKAVTTTDNFWIPICQNPDEINNETEREQGIWERNYENQIKDLDSRLSYVRISQEDYNKEMAALKSEDSLKQIEFNKAYRRADSLDKYYSIWMDQSMDYLNATSDEDYAIDKLYDKALAKEEVGSWPYKSLLAGKYELKYIPKSEKKKLKKELNHSVERRYRKSDFAISLHSGYSFFPYQYIEINLTAGYSDFIFSQLFPFAASIGLGYEKGLDLDIESYKAIIMSQPIGPIHGAVNFLFNKNTLTQQTAFGFRLEFGFNISALTILYGYNFINEEKFPGAKGNKVGVRLNIPVWRPNDYQKSWGNNLFRY